MLTLTVPRFMLALQLLVTFTANLNALPITSKPIEGTAEHLAWQAWLMLPPEQKNLEKSRKVTPKSIFTLPFRECPAGHQLFENRCIPTVNIDQTALITQQLLGLVGGGDGDGNAESLYEFDYDDIGSDEELIDVMFDPGEKFKNNNNNQDAYIYDQLPSQDEPLKFNIFQQKFPTDYAEAEPLLSDMPEEINLSSTTPKINTTTEMVSTTTTTTKEPSKNNSITDLQMESSNISMNIAENIKGNDSKETDDNATSPTAFSISDIDAIVLQAVPISDSKLESNEQKNVHKFSLFKDDSSVQLISSSLPTDRSNEPQKQPDLKQLLKAEDLLSLPKITAQTVSSNINSRRGVSSPSSSTTTTTGTVTTTLSDNELSRTTTVSLTDDGHNATTSLNDGFSKVTDMMLPDDETTIPTLLDKLVENDEKVVTPGESEFGHKSKEERTKSVITAMTEAQQEEEEGDFTTTTEPDVTTNFQLDEATVNEVNDAAAAPAPAPTIALKELLELAQHPYVGIRENVGIVKKSKVEPVELPPIIFTDEKSDSVSVASVTKMRTLTPTPETTVGMTTSSTSLPALNSIKNDRFDNKLMNITSESDVRQRNDEQRNDNKLNKNIKVTNSTMIKSSEIDIKQELRIINELVKGNNERSKQQKTAESGMATLLKKPAKANSFANEDQNSGSSTLNDNESRTSKTMTTTTVKITPTITPISPTTIFATKTTPIETTTNELTTAEPTSTIWSKIMPFLGFTTSFGEISTETEPTSATSSTINKSDIKKPENNIINQRNNRNSKIFRINNLSTPSYSSSIGSSSSISSISSSKSSDSNRNFVADTLVPSTTELSTTRTTTEVYDSNISSESDPFWWLPIGWRLDRSREDSDSDIASIGEPSLLLRFWSSFPESDSTSSLRK